MRRNANTWSRHGGNRKPGASVGHDHPIAADRHHKLLAGNLPTHGRPAPRAPRRPVRARRRAAISATPLFSVLGKSGMTHVSKARARIVRAVIKLSGRAGARTQNQADVRRGVQPQGRCLRLRLGPQRCDLAQPCHGRDIVHPAAGRRDTRRRSIRSSSRLAAPVTPES